MAEEEEMSEEEAEEYYFKMRPNRTKRESHQPMWDESEVRVPFHDQPPTLPPDRARPPIPRINSYYKKFKDLVPVDPGQMLDQPAREAIRTAHLYNKFLGARDAGVTMGMIPVIVKQRLNPELGRDKVGEAGDIINKPLTLMSGYVYRPGFPSGWFDRWNRQVYRKTAMRFEPVRPIATYDNHRPLPAPYSNSALAPLNWGVFGVGIPAPMIIPDINGFCYIDAFTATNYRRTVFPIVNDWAEGGYRVSIQLLTVGSTQDPVYVVINDKLTGGAVQPAPTLTINNAGARLFKIFTDTPAPVPLLNQDAVMDTVINNIVLHTIAAIQLVFVQVLTYACVEDVFYNANMPLGKEDTNITTQTG